MDCGAGGTTLRFLLAWAAVQPGGSYLITGIPRLLERPHAPLIEALQKLGARIDVSPDGIHVRGGELIGGSIILDSPISSQFISALLMIGPYMENGLQIEWRGRRYSEPYVEMTCRLMRHFGAEVDRSADRIEVKKGNYRSVPFIVPADMSAASFWFQVASLAQGARIELPDLLDDGLQGDAAAMKLWEHWVVSEERSDRTILYHRDRTEEEHFKADLSRTPDLFQPLIFTCAGRGIEATITGLHNLSFKETDRLADTQRILHQFGIRSWIDGSAFHLEKGDLSFPSDPIDPCGDHRMAMAVAPLALKGTPVRISDPQVVEKSYPAFWQDLQRAGFQVMLDEN